MRLRYTHIVLPCALALVTMLVLTGLVWMQMQARQAETKILNANIAEMARIDEILTTSALLAAATGDLSYRDRYYAHVDRLDDLLAESMGLFESGRADRMLRKTHDANVWLVEAEESALEAMRDGPDGLAYASLRSDAYARNKTAYTEGLTATVRELEAQAARRVGVMRSALWGLGTAFVLAAGVLVVALLRIRLRHRELMRRQEQVVVMRGMIATFMDLQNNLLNNMVYFRTKAAHDLPFDPEDVRMIDDEITRSKHKLSELLDSGIGTTRDLGGIVVVETAESCGAEEDEAERAAA